MSDESHPKTLYVGNLDVSVTEELICTLFSQMGPVKNCKIIRETGNDPYAFVEYHSHSYAATALSAMNKRLFLDKEMKVNWATSPGNQPKTDTSQHHHIFVGDLSPEIETDTLRGAFAPFGEISNCRIVRDPHTLRSKGYAFVSFVKKAEAENAIHSMNGQYLGSRSIRTNWSTRKPPAPRESIKVGGKIGKTPNYEDIYNQTSPTNATVYCGGFPQNFITDELIHKHFGQFGTIQDTRVFKDKGYAFIKFTSKEAATHAIEGTHLQEVNGHSVKCFWGKENGGDMSANSGMVGLGGQQNLINNNIAYHAIAPQHHQPHQATQQPQQPPQTHSNPSPQLTQAAAQYPYNYQQMGYWYPGYPAAAAAQMQAQYMQQGYYQYAFPQQQGYRMVQQPTMAAGWQVPVAATNGAAAAAITVPSPQSMLYNTLPQFQTQ